MAVKKKAQKKVAVKKTGTKKKVQKKAKTTKAPKKKVAKTTKAKVIKKKISKVSSERKVTKKKKVVKKAPEVTVAKKKSMKKKDKPAEEKATKKTTKANVSKNKETIAKKNKVVTAKKAAKKIKVEEREEIEFPENITNLAETLVRQSVAENFQNNDEEIDVNEEKKGKRKKGRKKIEEKVELKLEEEAQEIVEEIDENNKNIEDNEELGSEESLQAIAEREIKKASEDLKDKDEGEILTNLAEEVQDGLSALSEDYGVEDIRKIIQDIDFFNTDDTDECLERYCENLQTTLGYCRYHYIKNWKGIKKKKAILQEGRLQKFIEDLLLKYPVKYIEAIMKDLSGDKEFFQVLKDLNIESNYGDDDASDLEMDDDISLETRSYVSVRMKYDDEEEI